MSNLKYDKTGRLLFTKEMKKDYTLLMPTMLPIHFGFFDEIFKLHGYNTVLLDTTGQDIIEEGLRSVHNDFCYPALLTTGQLLHALKSGKYDMNKTALVMSQTGGGCRASNYIHIIRKALKNQHLEHVPVISFNLVGLEKNPGFKMTPKIITQLTYAVIYGDLLMWLSNQTRPYEKNQGDTDKLLAHWMDIIKKDIQKSKSFLPKAANEKFIQIVKDFQAIERSGEEKIKVGVVGEIYIKYAALGNNNLEQFLHSEDTEVVIPPLLDFALYSLNNVLVDHRIYHKGSFKAAVVKVIFRLVYALQAKVHQAIIDHSSFRPMQSFEHIKELVKGYVDTGNKMGEGWLLTAEMLELIDSGIDNIICTQPFGCLPNHIVGKGMIRRIKQNHTNANIVAIDFDPGATKINQENRIKLMLATARRNMTAQTAANALLMRKNRGIKHVPAQNLTRGTRLKNGKKII